MEHPNLFSPIDLGPVRLRNRIVMLPMGTRMMVDGRVPERDITYHEERAVGGVGMVVFGGTVVHPTSVLRGRFLTEAYDPEGLEGLRRRAEAVKAAGAAAVGQILHLGRESPGGQSDYVPLAPSPKPSPRDPFQPKAMTTDEIAMVVRAFGDTAHNLEVTGHDGVEIHGAHGYLVAQFLSRSSNLRDDAYGPQDWDSRMRFLLEVIEEIRGRCGDGFAVGLRLSADEQTDDGLTLDDTRAIVERMQVRAPVDYVSVTIGMRGNYVKDASVPEGVGIPFAAAIKAVADVPVIAASRIRTPAVAERAIAEGQADLVGLGRALIADPEWAAKAQAGEAERIRPCIAYVQECRIAEGGIVCGVNARVGREEEWGPAVVRSRRPRSVVVVGGGPGGLEAARLAAEQGHRVTLLERSDRLGGQLLLASRGPTRHEIADFIPYVTGEARRAGAELRLGVDAGVDEVLAEEPDAVIVATGARPSGAPFTVDGGARVITSWAVLAADGPPSAGRALVVDDGQGFWTTISAAEVLAAAGTRVEIVTPSRAIGLAIPHESVPGMLGRLRDGGVTFRPFTTVAGVTGSTVSLLDAATGAVEDVEADLVAVTTPLVPRRGLLDELAGRVAHLTSIGDCAAPRRLSHAVLDANLAVRRLEADELEASARILF